MHKIILGQQYYKSENNNIVGYYGFEESLSDYSKKVYLRINDFLLNEVSEELLKDKDMFLISEIILIAYIDGDKEKKVESNYLELKEFLENKDLTSKYANFQLVFNSEIENINQDILNIMEILKKSIEKDIKLLIENKGVEKNETNNFI